VERPDATAWAILALQLSGSGAAALRGARQSLLRYQDRRGAVTLRPGSLAIAWPTPLAVLAWWGDPEHEPAAQRAVTFLLESGGEPLRQAPELGHDMSLRGWSWVLGTHSWVEPTALGLLALRLHGLGAHPRAQEAERLLVDRCLPSGGWNYGNTLAFGAELLPAVDSTGLALASLGRLDEAPETAPARGLEDAVRRSTAYLEREWARGLRTPLAMGCALLGLSAWARRPPEVEAQVAATLSRQAELGPFDTAEIGLALAAAAAEGGLLAAMRS
jgi:hypothetical protein